MQNKQYRQLERPKKIPAEDSCGQPVTGAHTTRAVWWQGPSTSFEGSSGPRALEQQEPLLSGSTREAARRCWRQDPALALWLELRSLGHSLPNFLLPQITSDSEYGPAASWAGGERGGLWHFRLSLWGGLSTGDLWWSLPGWQIAPGGLGYSLRSLLTISQLYRAEKDLYVFDHWVYESPRTGQTSQISRDGYLQVEVKYTFRLTGIFPMLSVALGLVLKVLLLISYYLSPVQIH